MIPITFSFQCAFKSVQPAHSDGMPWTTYLLQQQQQQEQQYQHQMCFQMAKNILIFIFSIFIGLTLLGIVYITCFTVMDCNPFNHSSCNSVTKRNNSKLGNHVKNIYNKTELMKSLTMNLRKEMQDLEKLTEETTRLVINNRPATKYHKTKSVQDDFIDLTNHNQQLKSISDQVNSITNNMNSVKEDLNTIIALHSMLETIQYLSNRDQ